MSMYLLGSVDQIKKSQDCNRDPHCWSIDHGDQRLWKINIGLHVLPASYRKRVGKGLKKKTKKKKKYRFQAFLK